MENVPKYTSISLQHVCDETHSPYFEDHLLVAVERYGWRSLDAMARQNFERCHGEGVKPVQRRDNSSNHHCQKRRHCQAFFVNRLRGGGGGRVVSRARESMNLELLRKSFVQVMPSRDESRLPVVIRSWGLILHYFSPICRNSGSKLSRGALNRIFTDNDRTHINILSLGM